MVKLRQKLLQQAKRADCAEQDVRVRLPLHELRERLRCKSSPMTVRVIAASQDG